MDLTCGAVLRNHPHRFHFKVLSIGLVRVGAGRDAVLGLAGHLDLLSDVLAQLVLLAVKDVQRTNRSCG